MSPLDDDLNTFYFYSRGLSLAGVEERSSPEAGGGNESPVLAKETPAETSAESIDLPALADRIYALLKQELRLERERLGRNTSW